VLHLGEWIKRATTRVPEIVRERNEVTKFERIAIAIRLAVIERRPLIHGEPEDPVRAGLSPRLAPAPAGPAPRHNRHYASSARRG